MREPEQPHSKPPSSAMASVLLSRKVEEMTGRGAGLSSEGLERKIRVIQRAIEVNQPDKEDRFQIRGCFPSVSIPIFTGITSIP